MKPKRDSPLRDFPATTGRGFRCRAADFAGTFGVDDAGVATVFAAAAAAAAAAGGIAAGDCITGRVVGCDLVELVSLALVA